MYKKFRNTVTLEIKKAKDDYYKRKFAAVAGDIKKTWKVVNNILGNASKKNILPQKMNYNGHSVEGTSAICDVFNEYFINIGHKLASSCRNSSDYSKHVQFNCSTAFLSHVLLRMLLTLYAISKMVKVQVMMELMYLW